MASIATVVAVAAILLVLALLIFEAVARGTPRGRGHEVEVKLFFVTIRRKIDAADSDMASEPDEDAGSRASSDPPS